MKGKSDVLLAAGHSVQIKIAHSNDTTYISTITGILLFVSSVSLFSSVAFSLLLSLSVSALMSQAHCAERNGSNVSILQALNSQV